jgi:hypothetical protein
MAERFAKEVIESAESAETLKAATEEVAQRFLDASPLSFKNQGDEPAALGDDLRPRVEISSPFNVLQRPIRNALGGDVANLAFALEEPDAVHPGAIETSEGYAIMQLKGKEPATRQQFDEDKRRLLTQLRQVKATEALAKYVDELRESAGEELTFDQEILQSTEPPKDDEEEDES